MLLTISTEHNPATDLGFLLHKHPDRFQSFDLSFGQAHVFYPDATEGRCTACLLLDVDPVGMVRRKGRNQSFLLGHYVNDRPYVASSFMSVAISQVFGTAMGGRCKDRPELVTTPISLTARLDVLPVRGGEDFLHRMFEPLGYTVEAVRHPLDERFPEWGESPYYSATISGTKTLAELLTHLYVLVPVFDNEKHYFVGEDELEKLLVNGTGWLASHPEKEQITRRYLKHRSSLYREALARLVDQEEGETVEDERTREDREETLERPLSLNDQRHGAVMAALRASGARTVLDLGCGEGKLLRELLQDRQFEQIVGMDVSIRSLEMAQKRLKLDRLPDRQAERLKLIHGSLIYRDKRLEGFDAAAVVATAALEVMSRFAANPKWLIYLPPTMSPCETSNEPGLLEHPAEAFSYFRSQGVPQVVCEDKHMGSRAVVVVCRDEDAARERFGVTEGEAGIIYTRTGRRFFNDAELETTFLDRLRAAMTASGFWDEFQTSWACLDCELMPWSAKAQELLRSQYAAVGSAGRASLPEAIGVLERAAGRMNGDSQTKTTAVLERLRSRRHSIEQFVAAYRQYCWSVESLSDLTMAPFHLLATEGKVHTDRNHVWHMETLAKVCQEDADILLATAFKVIDLTDLDSISAGIDWWTSLTGRGGEGMVVKPADWIVRGKKGLVQPAVKCRGKEYLRIIYSPDYDSQENLPRLRNRSLGRKRSLALREFALGLEGLERFVRREPLRRVHECVFGVLALESEPVDPRL